MLQSTWFRGNIYFGLAIKLSIALLLLFLSRVLIYFFNIPLFSGLGFGHLMFIFFAGLRFDLVTLVIINIPLIFFYAFPLNIRYNNTFQKLLNIVFNITNSLAIALNMIDVVYFRFSQKRMTFDIFSYIEDTGNEIISLLPNFITDFWYVFFLWILFVLLLIGTSRKIKIDPGPGRSSNTFKKYFYDTIKFIVVIILLVIAGRGGIQYRPVNIINAGEYTEPLYFPVLLNTPFTIIKTKDETVIIPQVYFTDKEELDDIFTPVKSYNHPTGKMKTLNVVIIILESFTSEHSAFLNPNLEGGNYNGYTPFLDSLMSHSLVFKGFANGEKSIDGIPAILSAIPSLMVGPFINSPYAGNSINSIASLLKEKGYTTSFYHGGTNGTMGFESYTKIAGFDLYAGRSQYNNENDFDGKWGIFDEEFLQFTARNLGESSEPFLAAIFTLSSHHPYTIPEKHKNKFPKGKLDIHESIGYSDFALKQFFKTVSKTDWFDSTLFVLTADHTYHGYYPFYRSSVGKYSVPVVFYQHGRNWENSKKITVQQTDIVPSILDYLGYNEQFIAFGESVFDTMVNHFSISYLSGIYQFISDGYVLKFNGEKDIAFYQLENDSLVQIPLTSKSNGVQHSMSNKTKAIKQQFDFRMVNNQLTSK